MPAKAPGAYAVHNICGDAMRWEQVVIYAVGALMVMSLTDGPRGFKMLARDVKRHVVGR